MEEDERILGVMQPYVFPYLGYFQYIRACSHFILYDDVQFIMRGWINRNRILLHGAPYLFSIPLNKASPNRTITETTIAESSWMEKLMNTFTQAYKKAPYWKDTHVVLQKVFEQRQKNISDLAATSIMVVCDHLEIPTVIIPTSSGFHNAHLARNARILDLCKKMNASTCIVPQGGSELYGKEEFAAHQVTLQYLKAGLPPYHQGMVKEFFPSLSIIDVLAWNSHDEIRGMLQSYTLV